MFSRDTMGKVKTVTLTKTLSIAGGFVRVRPSYLTPSSLSCDRRICISLRRRIRKDTGGTADVVG